MDDPSSSPEGTARVRLRIADGHREVVASSEGLRIVTGSGNLFEWLELGRQGAR